ncbi:hypothetical protein [Paenibacillus lutrae]|uniref:Lipoprotein n=1 Tax=Paenibacillus lutrae TaxID=2078573 RepID=A0A7X3K0C9_9BACL|nr:hypothetical protein [Paenibacillus lutrae]MVP01028.1 hypothetical protein [Paenibacillus lutrae]
MIKKVFVFSMACSVLMAGCQSEVVSEENKKPTKTDTIVSPSSQPAALPATVQPSQPPQSEIPILSKTVGLGDTQEEMEKYYGKNENTANETIHTYKQKSIVVMYADKVATNITLAFESTNKPRWKMEDALAESQNYIPVDAVKVKEYKLDEERTVVQYVSKQLAERLKEYYDFGKTLGNEDEPGTFIVILKQDQKGVFASIMAPGSKP